ncbi:hypothetical protein ABEB36_012987 [Hypothenemus hampei]|uniref:Deoxyuridine 5'-triphosphate nucleotidohydrolase n=1 Tax=Hypothenemus hampei TaxID=57062 RepID=A0ABD1E6G9_HYPHA
MLPSTNAKAQIEDNSILKYIKTTPEIFDPIKASSRSAGFDLMSSNDYGIPSRNRNLVDTGLKIQLPSGCYGKIAPRSRLALKYFVDDGADVIDGDYRGKVKVVMFNYSEETCFY